MVHVRLSLISANTRLRAAFSDVLRYRLRDRLRCLCLLALLPFASCGGDGIGAAADKAAAVGVVVIAAGAEGVALEAGVDGVAAVAGVTGAGGACIWLGPLSSVVRDAALRTQNPEERHSLPPPECNVCELCVELGKSRGMRTVSTWCWQRKS